MIVTRQLSAAAYARKAGARVIHSTMTAYPSGARLFLGNGAYLGDKFYFGGGRTTGGSGEVAFREFNPMTNAWTSKANTPASAGGNAYAALGDHVWGLGLTGVLGGSMRLDRYDPVGNSWTTGFAGFSAGDENNFACLLAAGGKLYSIENGGAFFEANTHTIREYDPDANTWTIRASHGDTNSPTAFAMATDGRRLWRCGGFHSGSTPMATKVYDPATNGWTTLAALPAGRSTPAAFFIRGVLYVAGGANSSAVAQASLYRYNAKDNTWSVLTSIGTGVNNMSYASNGWRAMLIGGQIAGGAATSLAQSII